MNKNKLNTIIDFILVGLLIIVGITGIGLFFFIGANFLGIERKIYYLLHNWSGILMVFLMIVHILLHLNWFKIKLMRG